MLNAQGKEVLDSQPKAPHVTTERQDSLQDMLQKYVRSTLSQQAHDDGAVETFEESQDFEIENDFDKPVELSGYEVIDMEPEYHPQQDFPESQNSEPEPAEENNQKASPKNQNQKEAQNQENENN